MALQTINLDDFSYRRPFGKVLLVYACLSVVLWFVPLFNLLHAESSAVIAGVAFFSAGLAGIRGFEESESLRSVILKQEVALVMPWALLTVTLLWVPNCGYFQGLLFFLLYAPFSVALGVALAYTITGSSSRYPRLLFGVVGLLLLIGSMVYDLGFHPQFYIYNHVFGGVMGPIYDEELTIRPGLVAFRGMTVLWTILALLVGLRLRQINAPSDEAYDASKQLGRSSKVLIASVLVAVLIGLGYLFSSSLGLNTTEHSIRQSLSGHAATEHFDIFYDPASLGEGEIKLMKEGHEYRYAQLAERLDLEVGNRIASYIYPNPEEKARLTGARFTNVAPVWLRRPQMHILLASYSRVFSHELGHVFSREFGLPLLRATLAVGLVEGLAVALEPPDGQPTPHEQVAVSLSRHSSSDSLSLTRDLAARLTPMGFWTGRGAVSYATSGSFVSFLLEGYGAERFKKVYARANYNEVYGKPLIDLAAEWESYIRAQPPVDSLVSQSILRRFDVPSLFEKRCPHYIPYYRRLYRKGRVALAERDTVLALASLETSLDHQPAYEPALSMWSRIMLGRGLHRDVLARLDTLGALGKTPVLHFLKADAYVLAENPDSATANYQVVAASIPNFATEQHAWLVMRKSLAETPQILRILSAPDSGNIKLEKLRQYPSIPWGGILRGLVAGQAGQYGEALDEMQESSFPDSHSLDQRTIRMMEGQRFVWLSTFAYQARRLEDAEFYARQAAKSFSELGDRNAAAKHTDFVQRMQWVREQERQ